MWNQKRSVPNMGPYSPPFSTFSFCKHMQFPWRHGEPLSGLHGYYSSEQTFSLVKSHIESGCCWAGRGFAQNQLDKRFNHMDEHWGRHTLLTLSFKQTHWLICSLTHLVNRHVSHFRSHIFIMICSLSHIIPHSRNHILVLVQLALV